MIWDISYKTKKYYVKHYENEDNEHTKQIHPHVYKSWLSINFPLLYSTNRCSKFLVVYHESSILERMVYFNTEHTIILDFDHY